MGEAYLKPWFAVRVRSRSERVCAQGFVIRGIDHFLPTYVVKRQWSDRMSNVEEPLFPGYIFCQLGAKRFIPILETPGVVQVLNEPVDPIEMSSIQKLVEHGGAIPWPYLEKGQRVRMTKGAFRGLEGLLESADGRSRVVVNIQLLHKAIAVEVDRDLIEPC